MTAAGNLVGNPDFETSTSGWGTSGGSAGVSITQVAGGHSGSYAAKLANTTTATVGTCLLNDSPNWVTKTSAGQYTGSLWVRADTAGATLNLRFREYTTSGSLLGTKTGTVTLSTTWQQVTVTMPVSTPGSTFDFNAYISNVAPGTCFYADDAAISYSSSVDLPPTAALTVTPKSGTTPLQVSADASGSTDNDSTPIAIYTFNFGDGTTVGPQSSATATHTYFTAGTYTITVTVADAARNDSTASQQVTVSGNLIGNPGFETGTSGWNTSGGSTGVSLTQVAGGHSGSYAAKLANTTTATVGTCLLNDSPNWVAKTSAGQYAGSMWVRADTAGASLNLRFREYNTSGSLLATKMNTVTLSTTWQQVTITMPVSTPGSTFDFNAYISNVAPGTCFYADDATIDYASSSPSDSPPNASLTVTPSSGVPPLAVTADASGSTDTDSTTIASYTFNFGDGTTVGPQSRPTAAHTYSAGATYTVTATVTDSAGLSSTATQTVTSDAPPVAQLSVAPSSGAVPLAVTADASGPTDSDATPIASYTFDFGDGTVVGPQASAIGTHSYKSGGTYTVTVTVTDTAGLSSTAFQAVTANAPPVGQLSVTPSSGRSPLAVTADASKSTANGSALITSYTFDFGDGTTVGPQSSATATHTYTTAGNYTVMMTVTDTTGLSSTATQAVTVTTDAPPTAQLKVTPSSGNTPLVVTADASGSTDTDATPIATYTFNFGDGTTVGPQSTATATHTYTTANTYTVTVTVTDTAGLSSSITATTTATASSARVATYAGYYDTHHLNTQPKPSPWMGSPNVIFLGKPDSSSGGWDSSAVRVDNLSGASLPFVSVTVDVGSDHFALWKTTSLGPGQTLIAAQTAYENFDGSDLNPAGCYGCSGTLCTTEVKSTVPVVHVTVNGVTTNYPDTRQILNTRGVDAAGCPPTGSRNDESQTWQQLSQSSP